MDAAQFVARRIGSPDVTVRPQAFPRRFRRSARRRCRGCSRGARRAAPGRPGRGVAGAPTPPRSRRLLRRASATWDCPSCQRPLAGTVGSVHSRFWMQRANGRAGGQFAAAIRRQVATTIARAGQADRDHAVRGNSGICTPAADCRLATDNCPAPAPTAGQVAPPLAAQAVRRACSCRDWSAQRRALWRYRRRFGPLLRTTMS